MVCSAERGINDTIGCDALNIIINVIGGRVIDCLGSRPEITHTN